MGYPPSSEEGPLPLCREPPLGWTRRRASHGDIPSYSLVFVVSRQDAKVLLGYKKRGFGAGLYNGFGGKPEPGENMLECAIRELEEESGLVAAVGGIDSVGEMLITRPIAGDPSSTTTIRVHVFVCRAWLGDPIETEEMCPTWVSVDLHDQSIGLPLSRMWPEAGIFIPPLMRSALSHTQVNLTAYIEYSMVVPDAVAPWQVVPQTGHKAEGKSKVDALSGWQININPVKTARS